jgi:hypothetical protein
VSYVEALERELAAVGITRRRRARILTEIEDHLACDPHASLGSPAALARQFADELGTSFVRRAALSSFLSLAVAGAGVAAAFLAQADQGLAREVGQTAPQWGNVGIWLMAIGGQVAFAAGLLAAIRAFRRRHEVTVSNAEAIVLLRRSAVGVCAGLVTMAGLGLTALALGGHVQSSWLRVAVIAAGIGSACLLAAVPPVLAARQLLPTGSGPAGDVFEDLGPQLRGRLRGNPWLLALAVAGAAALAIASAGVLQDDPFDGALRALVDAVACLAGFGLLGRFLGLRS